METKQKRARLKVIFSIIIPVLLITGVIAVSVYAEKPDSPPGLSKTETEPILVSLSGDMEGVGNPYAVRIEFLEASFGENAGEFISNPDYPPSLKVTGPGIHKRLDYYYCDDESHSFSDEEICTNTDHDPYNYKSLTISSGQVIKKTDKILFPAGSSWVIVKKIILPSGEWDGQVVAEGYLSNDITYEVLVWGDI